MLQKVNVKQSRHSVLYARINGTNHSWVGKEAVAHNMSSSEFIDALLTNVRRNKTAVVKPRKTVTKATSATKRKRVPRVSNKKTVSKRS